MRNNRHLFHFFLTLRRQLFSFLFFLVFFLNLLRTALSIHFLIITPKELFLCPMTFLLIPHLLINFIDLSQQPKHSLVLPSFSLINLITLLWLVIRKLNNLIPNTLTTLPQKIFCQSLPLQLTIKTLIFRLIQCPKNSSHS